MLLLIISDHDATSERGRDYTLYMHEGSVGSYLGRYMIGERSVPAKGVEEAPTTHPPTHLTTFGTADEIASPRAQRQKHEHVHSINFLIFKSTVIIVTFEMQPSPCP